MAIESNVASATIISGKSNFKQDSHLLKIAFDGDAVIFSDESEKIYHEKGISAFIKNETKGEKISLEPGPMKPFLMELNRLQREFTLDECPIRTALVTARSAPTHKRVIKTLREWGVRIDESLFLGGMSKEDFLKSFQADIFFDDQLKNIQDASGKITSAHVPYGVKNEVK
ncbi:MAG: hypothetical protein Ct9H90mP6_10990 [Gammaproteobacteria bacterium]|jgi:5'-nucleotidase|nr:MAG: hypothetical protein Ct9H90mP6_10990 [Gammaproteobacteria bacterium]